MKHQLLVDVFHLIMRVSYLVMKCVMKLVVCAMMQVGSLWEIDDGDGGDLVGRRGGLKRKRAGEGDGREKIEDFLQLNWHILSDYERDGTKALQLGIEPTLALMRSHRQASKPVVEERPKRLPPPVQAVKIEAVVSVFSRLLAAQFAALLMRLFSTRDVIFKALKCPCMRIYISLSMGMLEPAR